MSPAANSTLSTPASRAADRAVSSTSSARSRPTTRAGADARGIEERPQRGDAAVGVEDEVIDDRRQEHALGAVADMHLEERERLVADDDRRCGLVQVEIHLPSTGV